jgi:hypothetical protein
MGTHPRNTNRSQPFKTPITFEELRATIGQSFTGILASQWGFCQKARIPFLLPQQSFVGEIWFGNPSQPETHAGCTCSTTSSSRYTVCVWRNGVGLCWRATRQGITRPGRVNDPSAPAASTAWGLLRPSTSSSFICPVMPQKTHVRSANRLGFHLRLGCGYAALG